MAESICIPLTHIQNMLDETPPSWIYDRLHELKSMLIQIQYSANSRLLGIFPGESYRELYHRKDGIRQFAYQIDDQLDTISMNLESCGKWVNSDIPSVLKTLGIAYHKSKFLYNIRSLIDLVNKSEFDKSQNFNIKEWNELQRFVPQLHHDPSNSSYDFEESISMFNSNFKSLVHDLICKKKDETFIEIDLSKNYVYIKAIYDIISHQKHFQYVAWVSVLKNIQKIFVYRDILKQLLMYDKKNDVIGLMSINEDELQKELMKLLTIYKCFILLTFDQSLYDQNLVHQFNIPMTSKILVATHEEGSDYDHAASYGWKLLESVTMKNHDFEKEDFDLHEIKKIGLDLIKKCYCVPRQIIRIGGVLREKVSINRWKIVRECLSCRDFSDRQWKVVALCYDRLPIYLKACFLYFAQFWKGIDINTEMLYQMWMAEGIITTIDVAEDYLAILAKMLLIDVQESEFSTSRRFELCRIDNFIKTFCLHPDDLSTLVMFYREVEKTLYGLKSSITDGSKLSIKFDISSQGLKQGGIDVEIMDTIRKASKKLRSLLILKENGIPKIKISFPSEICKKFKLLRVLKIENIDIHGGKFPKDIRALIHLRFLSYSTFEEFPKTIGNFRFMQTLDLRVSEIIPEGIVVPNVLWKLKELRHLYLPICHRVPKGKDKLLLKGLNKLETLVNFDIEKVEHTSLEWKRLKHIDARVHGKKSICDVIAYINNSGDMLKETFLHASFSSFSYEESDVPLEDIFNCQKLNHLIVNWGRCDLNEFKVPNPFTSNLIELCLLRCQIKEDPMPILGKFPQLRKLVLGKKSFMGKYMSFEHNSFPALKHLKIKNLTYLEELEIHNKSMHNLFYFEIIYCLKLKMIPSGFMVLWNLSELKLRMPKKFNDRLRRQDVIEEDDFKTVEHIPFIYFEDL